MLGADKKKNGERTQDPGRLGRRAFMTGAVATAAGGGLAAAAQGGPLADTGASAPAAPGQPVYRETEHIRRFYRLARL